MVIYFQKCTNNSKLNKTDCYPDQIIEKKLESTFLSVTYINNDIILSNIDSPFKPFTTNNVLTLSSSIYKNYFREINEVRINSDKNLFFESYQEIKSFKMGNLRESVDLRRDHPIYPGTFSQMTFITSGDTLIYFRKYKKLFEVVIQIGGFSNGLFFVAYFILFLHSNNMILWNCISSIISKEEIMERLGHNYKINNKNKIKTETIFKSEMVNVNKKEDQKEDDHNSKNSNNIESNNIESNNLYIKNKNKGNNCNLNESNKYLQEERKENINEQNARNFKSESINKLNNSNR